MYIWYILLMKKYIFNKNLTPNKNNIAMKKNFLKDKNTDVKVAKLKNNSVENGIVIFIAVLLLTNLLISLKVLFG